MFIEPSAFYWKKDKRRSLAVFSSWANAAWSEESQGCPDLAARPDYAMGFRDGFVDFVYAGGTGEPPPIPPRKLWNVDFRSEEGHQRAEDWFAGYRHGAQVARNGGYRSLATLRSSLVGMPEDGAPGYPPDMWQSGGIDAQGNWPADESMPTPEVAPSQPMNAPETQRETQQPSESTPPAEAPTEEPESRAPEPTPIIPPPRHNLPPTTPRELELPEAEQPPVEPNELDNEPASQEKPADVKTSLDSESTSVRFVRAPIIAVVPPRVLPAASSPPSPIHQKPIGDRAPTRAQSTAIRLAAATSASKPAANEPPSSTIKIHPGTNDLRSRAMLEPIPTDSRFAR